MKKKILPIIFLFIVISSSAQYQIGGGSGTPLQVNNIPTPMIVYLLDGLQNAQISFTSDTEGTHQWFRYKEKASEAEPVPSQQTGRTSYITDIEDGYGYFVGEINIPSTRYVWIFDFSKYLPDLRSLQIEEDVDKCEKIKLIVDIYAPLLKYYMPTGSPAEIKRTYRLTYRKLNWEEESRTFIPEQKVEMPEGIVVERLIDAPLLNTTFTLTGDMFSEHFGKEQTLQTPEYEAIAIKAYAFLDRKKENGDNEYGESGGENDYGGSAPIDITFTAYANEPVAAFYVWKITPSNTASKWEPVVRYTDRILHYTFNEEGTFKVILEVSGQEKACADSTQFFNVTIGASDIRIPQAFSPGSSPGINDEFKIAYSSILKFKCTIFNRNGTKLYEWNDPSKGWDGRVNGKLVPTGVYFYVIQYTGTNHKSRVKKGSVNVLRGKN